MLRLFRMTNVSRALTVIVAIACVALILTPPLPQARGAGSTSIAVIEPENTAHLPASVIDQMARALYDGVVSTGHYDVKGGGPIKVEAAGTGDVFVAALGAASRAGADHVLITDVLTVANGKVLYRMSVYQVAPVTFIRSQVFSQPFPPTDPRVLATQFAANVATLEAPRTYTGVIYALQPALTSDTGSNDGFHLGQRFNVVRNGKKVAEAQIVGLAEGSATVDILNPSPGYQVQINDLLISQEQGPAVPAAPSGNNAALTVIGVLVGVAAGLIAINNSAHQAPSVQCPPPTPSGANCSAPPTGAGSFTVSATGQTGAPNQPTLQFTFSQPVLGALTFPFGGTTQLYMTSQVGIAGAPTPPQPIAGFAGATGSFDATGTVMTITTTGVLTPGNVYFIVFTSAIRSTSGTALTFTSFRYPAGSGVCCLATAVRPASVPRNSGTHGNNPSGSGANGGASGNSQPHTPAPHGGSSSH